MRFFLSNTLALISLAAISDFMLAGVKCQQPMHEMEVTNLEESQQQLPFQVPWD